MDSFEKVVVEVPNEKNFSEFELLFNKFSKAFYILLGNDPNHDTLMPNRLKLAMSTHKNIWETFVAIARLYRPSRYYKRLVQNWEDDRDDKMATLRIKTGRFLDSVEDLNKPSRLMSEAERKFLTEAANDDDLTEPISAEKELEFVRSLLA